MNRVYVALGAALLAASCGGASSSSPLAPSATATATTETFTGSVDPAGLDFHVFTIGRTGGQVDVTLTAAGPPSTIFMGLGVGTPSGGLCVPIANASVLVQAATTPQLSGTASAGDYCVAVFDAGNQTSTITYSVTVAHF